MYATIGCVLRKAFADDTILGVHREPVHINFLLNHHAWVHVQYTPAWGGNTNTPPKTEPRVRVGPA